MASALLLMFCSPALADQDGDYAFGLSDSVVREKPKTTTDWLLDQQRHSPPSQKSELPAQLYVDSQRRISDTFKQPIPESIQDKATSTDDN
ncbi:hypothetical protein A11A3_09145 [Alcanivorax hongdengensis A-11-3]|uniref:Uncharacterized protein n=1 Tax=Alcanivorax hongdengensis A-11-3 TaxID=1177179 RepID=L0WBH7_9GAMM|nr:hypothetical protein [Alcanivorax hongdengensis]EKF74354.1 hypothetical protein A11A3_09145 [Alcanivorax hongdengensis A-11-3]